MNVIVLGTNHYNTLGLVWSLGEAGHDITLLLYECNDSFVDKSKYIHKTIIIHKNNDDVVDIIRGIAPLMNQRPVVFVTNDNDAAMLNERFDELSEVCFFEGGRPDGSINQYRNKDRAEQLAVKCGFVIPNTSILMSLEVLDTEKLSYPLLVKANNSIHGGKAAMRKCDSSTDAERFISTLPTEYFPIQIQEYINKEYEVMLLGCSLYGGTRVICPVANKKHRHFPEPTGLGSYSESLDVAQNEDLQQLASKVAVYMQKIGYTGLFSAEFLYRSGQYYFLEVNLRNDGTSWLSTCSGFNLPDMVCRAFVDSDVSADSCRFVRTEFMNIKADFNHVRSGRIKLGRWLNQLRKCTSYSHYNKCDVYPFWIYIWTNIKMVIKKR